MFVRNWPVLRVSQTGFLQVILVDSVNNSVGVHSIARCSFNRILTTSFSNFVLLSFLHLTFVSVSCFHFLKISPISSFHAKWTSWFSLQNLFHVKFTQRGSSGQLSPLRQLSQHSQHSKQSKEKKLTRRRPPCCTELDSLRNPSPGFCERTLWYYPRRSEFWCSVL